MLAHLSPGEIFRQEIARQSPLGRRVQHYVTSGRLVPDSLVVQVMADRIRRYRAGQGFVLDGFPRTAGQAAGLDRILRRQRQSLSGAVYLTSPEPLLVRRLSGRRVCGRCGASYHLRTMRPKRAGVCDRCRGRLITRKDDQPDTIKKRLSLDRKSATPLLTYYRRRQLLHRVDGRGHIDTVYRRTLRVFRRLGWVSDDRTQNRRGT